LKAAKGEDIDEDDDIEKDIALFRMQIKNEVNVKHVKSADVIKNILVFEISPILLELKKILDPFGEDFQMNHCVITFFFNGNFKYPKVAAITTEVAEEIGKDLVLCREISWNLQFLRFKNSDNDFSISSLGSAQFGEYEYYIWDSDQNVIVSKLYHETLSKHDRKKVIRSFVNNVKSQIQTNLTKSP
jgi:hypothetical protein